MFLIKYIYIYITAFLQVSHVLHVCRFSCSQRLFKHSILIVLPLRVLNLFLICSDLQISIVVALPGKHIKPYCAAHKMCALKLHQVSKA